LDWSESDEKHLKADQNILNSANFLPTARISIYGCDNVSLVDQNMLIFSIEKLK